MGFEVWRQIPVPWMVNAGIMNQAWLGEGVSGRSFHGELVKSV